MKSKKQTHSASVWFWLGTTLAITCSAVHAQSYAISWYKIAGGGGTSSNGLYQVSGTIGQHNAGSALAGGVYVLNGGFWSSISPVQTAGAPTLIITRSGHNVIVAWPDSGTFTLQQTSTLAKSTGWTTSTYMVNTANGTNSVTISSPSGSLFFRLTH